ncbi:putative transcriptional regulator [Bacillus mesophilus]|uniref:HNH endonuclease n=1 Tax=Bacillus mesophilus TaxID=1808955 RepID=A0A6M0Q9D6_9BACI|nr:HNH endonuclease signature motif containing protein [Bacillus mesophilus]MBM7661697.1 putative transcriptional regulator [Bacillus mesophilus]NEY72359.1 HNH endonuclease [Bacillus mesophilus]
MPSKWKNILTRDYLEQLCMMYSLKEMCEVTGVPQTTMSSYLKKFNLTTIDLTKTAKSYKDVLTSEFLSKQYPNKTVTEIAKMIGCSRNVVDKYLIRYGLYTYKKLPRGGLLNSVADKLSYEYLVNIHKEMEVKEIAKVTGCAPSTVRKYLHLHGLSIKNSRLGKTKGAKNPNWKGGWSRNGYKFVQDPQSGKSKREHVLVIETFIGRELYVDEVVHHLNGVRDDNRLDNLLLMTKKQHDFYHKLVKFTSIDYTRHTKKDFLTLLDEVENICRVRWDRDFVPAKLRTGLTEYSQVDDSELKK